MRRVLRWSLGGVLSVLGAASLLAGLPLRRKLRSQPAPAADYVTALERIAALQAEDGPEINRLCRTQALVHGQRTARSIVLFHGFTNCPQQFLRLGSEFYERGYNVLLPRLPYHGLEDRLTRHQARLRAEDLTHLIDASVDIAAGLGEHVTVAGMSAGGVMASWAAQYRREVDVAAIIAPALGVSIVPTRWTRSAMHLAVRLPALFFWWDSKVREAVPGPAYAYPRFATSALGQILRLGATVQDAASHTPPTARSILLAINPADMAVNNELAHQLAAAWQEQQATLRIYEFDRELNLIHDLIDPEQPDQQIERVYPLLLELMCE